MSSNFNFPNPQNPQGNPDFTPKARIISAMDQGLITRVTTSEEHGYQNGWQVALYVPLSYGFNLVGERANIIVVSDTEFDVPIDTSIYPTFTVPTFPPPFTLAQCVPISGTTDNVA